MIVAPKDWLVRERLEINFLTVLGFIVAALQRRTGFRWVNFCS
jgi:hypothetical protein